MNDESPWLTVEEAAPRLKMHPDTLRRYCREGISPAPLIAVRWGVSQWRISRAALERLENGQFNPGVAS